MSWKERISENVNKIEEKANRLMNSNGTNIFADFGIAVAGGFIEANSLYSGNFIKGGVAAGIGAVLAWGNGYMRTNLIEAKRNDPEVRKRLYRIIELYTASEICFQQGLTIFKIGLNDNLAEMKFAGVVSIGLGIIFMGMAEEVAHSQE